MLYQARQPPFLSLECRAELAASEWVYSEERVVLKTPNFNPLDYLIWGAMLDRYHKHQQKPKMADELKVALQTIWEEL